MSETSGGQPRSARSGARRSALGAIALLGVTVALWVAREEEDPRERRFALSPQECNTECQSRQTDCIDDCEGKLACERRCTEAGLRCVARCAGLGADAGSGGGAGGRGGAGGSGGAAGSGGGGNGGQAGAR